MNSPNLAQEQQETAVFSWGCTQCPPKSILSVWSFTQSKRALKTVKFNNTENVGSLKVKTNKKSLQLSHV
jgi:hypothetical protein